MTNLRLLLTNKQMFCSFKIHVSMLPLKLFLMVFEIHHFIQGLNYIIHLTVTDYLYTINLMYPLIIVILDIMLTTTSTIMIIIIIIMIMVNIIVLDMY